MNSLCFFVSLLLAVTLIHANMNVWNGRFLSKTLLTVSSAKSGPKKPVIKFIDGSSDDDEEIDLSESKPAFAQSKPNPIRSEDVLASKTEDDASSYSTDEIGPESPSFSKPLDFDDKVAELEKLGWPSEIAKKALIASSYDVAKAAEFLEVQEEETDNMNIQAQELVLQGWNETFAVHAMMQAGGNLTAAQLWLETRENQLMTNFNQSIINMVKGGWNELIARKAVMLQWAYDRKKGDATATVEEDGLTAEQLAQYSPSLRLQKQSIESAASSAASTGATSAKSSAPPPTPPEAKRNEVIFEVTSSNFQSLVVDSKVPVLIDIYADWCGPCKQLTPILESAAVKGGGLFRLAKVNADTDRAIVDALEVTGFPTVFVWNRGKLIDRIVGFQQGDVLQKALMFAVMGAGKRHSESELTEKELAELTKSITSLAGLSGISFGTKSRVHQLIESTLKNSSYSLTPGMNQALSQISATQKDIWLKQNRVLNISSDDLLRTDKQAQLLLEIAGFKPVMFDEQHQPLSMELSHYNVAVLNLVTQHVADTLKKAKFSAMNNAPVVASSDEKKPEPVKEQTTATVQATSSVSPAALPASNSSPMAAAPLKVKPAPAVAPVPSKTIAAASTPSAVSITFRSLDNSVLKLSVPAAQSKYMTLREALSEVTSSRPLTASDSWRVQIRHPTSATVTADSELLDTSVASVAGKGSSITLQELEPSKSKSTTSGSLMNQIRKSVGLSSSAAAGSKKSAVGATHTLFSRGLRKSSDLKRNEYFGGDSTVFLSKLDEDEKDNNVKTVVDEVNGKKKKHAGVAAGKTATAATGKESTQGSNESSAKKVEGVKVIPAEDAVEGNEDEEEEGDEETNSDDDNEDGDEAEGEGGTEEEDESEETSEEESESEEESSEYSEDIEEGEEGDEEESEEEGDHDSEEEGDEK